jgi:Family of unknown function (DUF5681)
MTMSTDGASSRATKAPAGRVTASDNAEANSGASERLPHLWKPGQSGNPAGKPRGTLHKATQAALELMEGEAEAITRKCIEEAKAGNMVAMKLFLDRIVPQSRSRRITLELPPIETAVDCMKAQGIITAAMAAGDLAPDEAETAVNVVEMKRRAIETVEFEKRIETLEKEKGIAS